MPTEPAPRNPRKGHGIPGGLAAGAVILAAALFSWWHQPAAAPPAVVRASATPAVAPSAPVLASAPLAEAAAAPAPGPMPLPASNAFTTLEDYRQRRAAMPRGAAPLDPPPPGRTPETELGRVTFLVRDYRAAFGSNPVGSNKEITRALLGDNPRGTKFVDPAAVTLNARGELLDAWGHPYFFHAMSGRLMEIRSAGPDGRIFTADDLVQ